MLVAVNVPVTPDGSPDTESETAPVNGASRTIVTNTVPLPPWASDSVDVAARTKDPFEVGPVEPVPPESELPPQPSAKSGPTSPIKAAVARSAAGRVHEREEECMGVRSGRLMSRVSAGSGVFIGRDSHCAKDVREASSREAALGRRQRNGCFARRFAHSTVGLSGFHMTNPNDSWRHQAPAAPHAPPHDRLTPGLPLDGGASQQPIGVGSEPFRYSGAPSDAALNVGLLLGSIILVVIFSGVIFPSLYPLPSLVAFLGGAVADKVLSVVDPGLDASSRLPIAMLAAAIVFWPMMRLDYRLAAGFAPYRIGRHVLRLFIIGAFSSLSSMADLFRFSFTARGWRPVLFSDPEHFITFVVFAVAAHLFLTKATRARGYWTKALTVLRLRPRAAVGG
jgi:hypothetical protein